MCSASRASKWKNPSFTAFDEFRAQFYGTNMFHAQFYGTNMFHMLEVAWFFMVWD